MQVNWTGLLPENSFRPARSSEGAMRLLNGRELQTVIASEAKQSSFFGGRNQLDCFVAELLAMTTESLAGITLTSRPD
jgi:hypothetical protein